MLSSTDRMPAVLAEIGPYRVIRPLGQGGMGTVLLAEDSRLSRLVALKTFSGPEARSLHAREHLLSEARAAAALSHPNIASVHDVLDIDGQVVIVFEYVEGETLASQLGRGPLSVPSSLAIAAQLADALAAAHVQGIIHRDLKPGNVIITSDDRAKVLDFGIARVLPPEPAGDATANTAPAVFVGTIGYAAPEQCLGQPVDVRADVFSLGVVLFEMLTGKRPFLGGDATTVMRAMLQSDPPSVSESVPGVPLALDSLITRSLARNPGHRPQTVGEFREGLRSIATERRPLPVVRPRGRRWVAAAMLAIAIGTGALVSSLIWNRSTLPTPGPPPRPVVAVVPLANASGDDGKSYIAVGVAESLITRLASLSSITVLSRSAVADARARIRDLPGLAAELDATYLVDGSVQQVGDRLRVTLTLVRPDASVAWADTVEGSFGGIFDLQTRLASVLAQALVVQLSAADRASLAQQPTMNPDALAAYWRGRALLERRDVKGNTEAALAAFDEAVRLDAQFADAHAARGEGLWILYGETKSPELPQQAIAAGTQAQRLGPNRPQVRYSLALTLDGIGRREDAIDELQGALALQPNYDDARRLLGQVLAKQGRIDDAVSEFRKAIALRPAFWGHYSVLGVTLFQAARYEEAEYAFKRVTELQPDSPFGYQQLGTLYQTLGRNESALAQYRKAIAIAPSPQALSNMGALLHAQGDFEGAVQAYRRAIELRPNSHVTHRNLGDALTRLGRPDEAREAYSLAITLVQSELSVDPSSARNLAFLAVYQAKAGRQAEAQERIEEALRLAPDDPQVRFRSAVVYALAGKTDRAVQDATVAVSHGLSRSLVAEEEDLASLRGVASFRALTQGNSNKGERR